MKQISLFLLLIMLSINTFSKIIYPKTSKGNTVDKYFGTEVKEPYRWLENDTSSETGQWVKAQNKVTYDYLSKIPFRSDLKKRLTALTNYPKYSSPFKKNGQYFYLKNNGLQNQSVLYQQANLTATPEVFLDPNTLSADGTVSLATMSFSNNGKYFGYAISRSGSDWNEIFVMDAKTKQLLTDHIQWAKFAGIAWQGNGFYYSAYDAPVAGKEFSNKNEYHKIYYHIVGQLQSEDKLIYENKKFPLRNCGASVTDDEKFMIVTETESTTGNSLYFKDLTDPNASLVELSSGFDNDYSIVEHFDGKLYLKTNWQAPKQRLLEIDPKNSSRQNWKEILPQTEDVLESVSIIGGKIIAVYMKDATNHAYSFDVTGKKLFEVQLPTLGDLSSFSGGRRFVSA